MTRQDACFARARPMLGHVTAVAAAVCSVLPASVPVAAQVQLRVEVALPGTSLGAAVEFPLTERLSLTGGARLLRTAPGCPAVVPSTSGDDGRSVFLGLRPYLVDIGAARVALDVEAGWYDYTEEARRTHGAPYAGARAVLSWRSRGPTFEFAAGFQHVRGFRDGRGLAFPPFDRASVGVGVGIPLAR